MLEEEKEVTTARSQTLKLYGLELPPDDSDDDNELPCLVSVCNDPLLSGVVTYALHEGKSMTMGSDSSCDVCIDGLQIQPVMCRITNEGSEVVLEPVFEGVSSTPGTARRGSLHPALYIRNA